MRQGRAWRKMKMRTWRVCCAPCCLTTIDQALIRGLVTARPCSVVDLPPSMWRASVDPAPAPYRGLSCVNQGAQHADQVTMSLPLEVPSLLGIRALRAAQPRPASPFERYACAIPGAVGVCRAMSQMNPANSRATAATTFTVCLPAADSRLNLAQRRTWAFQAMARI